MLSHTDQPGRVKGIMEKHTKRTKLNIGSGMSKEKKFEENMKIFKGLNTYFESKDLMHKIN